MRTPPAAEEKTPQVSVLMPFHRVDAFLEEAIRSMLHQTFRDFELLLIADARLGSVEREMEQLSGGDPRVRVLPGLSVGGLAANLNLGISEARGEYIARMDSDDISLPERLEAQLRFLQQHREIAVLGARLTLMDEYNRTIQQTYPFYETNAAVRAVLPMRNPMPHPALMFRKEVLLALGGYKYAHSAEDWELLIRLARNRQWHLHNLDQVLVQYRRHSAQITRPELTRTVFYETAAFLFGEFLRTGRPAYLFAIMVKLPLLVRARLLVRRVRGGAVPVPQT